MQVNGNEKTIEADLFKAFVAASAISKANADDPKKSSLVRCARTDKGVHAAGNVISLKLIIEDEDIVDKINAELPEQIRIWAVTRPATQDGTSISCLATVFYLPTPSLSWAKNWLSWPRSMVSRMSWLLGWRMSRISGPMWKRRRSSPSWPG
ncbi:hypothetical protein LB505_000323 [Fusarium chuoi]|nr:hypothetical protein LB505_000323 [Fusarium chuoi]